MKRCREVDAEREDVGRARERKVCGRWGSEMWRAREGMSGVGERRARERGRN